MWFKNLRLYRLESLPLLSAEQIGERLEEHRFTRCGKHEQIRLGWCPPLGGHTTKLLHSSQKALLVCLAEEEKVIPASTIKEGLQERIAEIEHSQGRAVRKREKDQLREELLATLVTQALTRISRIHAWVDLEKQWVVVDSSSENKAEQLVQQLRMSLGSLPVAPMSSERLPAVVMTEWLQTQQVPEGWLIEENCVLRAREDERSTIRCTRQNILSPEIGAHLNTGHQVIQLELSWRDRVCFVLDEDWVIRRLRFLDLVKEESAASEADDAVQQAEVDFILQLGLLRPCLEELDAALS